MIPLGRFEQIHLYRPFVDFRKSINGLSLIVQEEMKLSPFSNYLFIFTNKRKNKLKVLYWDKTGFALWYKRLEKDRFRWPVKMPTTQMVISNEQLKWLLDGYDFWKMKPHQRLTYQEV